VEFMVDSRTFGPLFPELFGFRSQFSFHQPFHIHQPSCHRRCTISMPTPPLEKKFWELIVDLPSVRYGPHRKRFIQQFLVTLGTCLIGGYTGRPTSSPLIRHAPHRKRRVQQFFCCYVCICCRGIVFTEPLPSNIQTQTDGIDL
jgi:hypothetical protein